MFLRPADHLLISSCFPCSNTKINRAISRTSFDQPVNQSITKFFYQTKATGEPVAQLVESRVVMGGREFDSGRTNTQDLEIINRIVSFLKRRGAESIRGKLLFGIK